jgi:hypothetical protein
VEWELLFSRLGHISLAREPEETWCLGEVPTPGGEGAHAAVYSVPVLLEAHSPPPDSVGHPRAASSEEVRGHEPSGTRPEASTALGTRRGARSLLSRVPPSVHRPPAPNNGLDPVV